LSTGCYASSGAAFDSKITFGASDCRLDHYLLSRTDQYGGLSESDATGAGGLVISGDGTLAAQNGDAARTVRDDGQAGIRCDRTFIDAVLSGDASKIRSPYADAVRSLAFTLACNQSLDTGLPVTLE
jgi:hypothetical protein